MNTGKVKLLKFSFFGVLLLILAVIAGCSGNDPVSPSGNTDGLSANISVNYPDGANRHLWGLWDITIDTENMTAEMVPLRDGEYHYNVLQMLEGWACTDCVRIVNLSYNEDENLEVDIGIRHPYPTNRLDLTGRDVRGIAIFPSSLYFPNHSVRNKDLLEVPLFASEFVVNADGWTTHYNRETAYEGTGLWDYRKGKMTFPDENTIVGNLHPFKEFHTHDFKRLFYPGHEVVQTYEIAIPFQGEFTFGYSVDASWSMPLTWPVTNPITDFSISAGSCEPFQISMTIDANDITQQGGSADLTFEIFDHQGFESISIITVEAPDLWDGVKSIDPTVPVFSNDEMAQYKFLCPNESGYAQVDDGGSELMIVVEDTTMSVVGEDIRAYHIFQIPVKDVSKDWRPRGGWFDHLELTGGAPTPDEYDITVIANPQEPWAFVPGESMVLFANDNSESYVVYNRDFTEWKHLAGYPGNPNSWIRDTQRIDATFNGALGVSSDSDEEVVGEYLVRNCTNMHYEGAIYSTSWYTGSLNDPTPYLEIPGDLSGGFGTAVGDPLYSLYINDIFSLYLDPFYSSIHRIAQPYDDAYEVQRAFLPNVFLLNGESGPHGISEPYFVALGIDDEPFGEVSPYVVHVYAGENEATGPNLNKKELDIFKVNFADVDDITHVKTYSTTMIGASFIGPIIGNPELIDVDVLPALFNEIYMGNESYAEHNWVALLFKANPNRWFIEIFDPLAEDGYWQNPIYLIGPYNGRPAAMDVDSVNFEIYVLHDDNPSGTGQMQVTCLEYY